ncbi:MAG TPA: cellulose binding domain-containing protein [Polyangia bacterium]|nr:cellulose binding domain-containing protein [Polyangia bacterium]
MAARGLAAASLFALGLVACQGPDEYFRNALPGTGGTTSGSGTGGDNSGTGGDTGTGGIIATGGVPGTGGVVATGGIRGTGGITGGGGRATGGVTGGGGAAGARATGGVTGRAGAGGSVAAGGAGGAATCTGCKLEIQAYCQSASSTSAITVDVDVVNNSTTAVALNTVTFRYWFSMGAITDMPVLNINYAKIGSTLITSKFVALSPAVTGANEYLEIEFTKSAPTLALFSDTGEIQLAFHSTGYSSMFAPTQATDYSFQKCAAGEPTNMFNLAPTITGYINGTLAYGTEPM